MTEHALPVHEPSSNEITLFAHAFRERLPLLIETLSAVKRRQLT